MNKKKWMAGFCVVILLIVVFLVVYHGQYTQPETRQQQTVLKWMIYGEKYQESDQVFLRFNEALQEYCPGIFIEFEVVPKAGYERKWEMKMAGNETVDIAWVGSEVLNFTEEVKKGSFMALDYLLNDCGPDLKEKIPEVLWKKQSRDGNIYGIPVQGPLYDKNYVLTVNETLMERYGDMEKILRVNREHLYTTKECFQVIEPFLEQVKANNALGSGISYKTLCTIADKGCEGMYGVDCPFVIRIFDEKLRVYNKYELDSYRSCFETMADWYQKGYIREDVAYLLDPISEDGKKSGNILFVEEYGEKETVWDAKDTEYPALRGELDGYRYISHETCRNCLVIPKTAKHPREAVQVINLLNSEEGKGLYRLLVNGIEKEQYIRVSSESDVIARMTGDDRKYRYGIPPVNIGSIFQNYQLCEGQFDQFREYNDLALHSPLEGFELDTRMFAIEMAKVELVVKKYKDRLCQGISEDWEADYQAFLQEMRSAGSQKIIEEIQKQIDTFTETIELQNKILK